MSRKSKIFVVVLTCVVVLSVVYKTQTTEIPAEATSTSKTLITTCGKDTTTVQTKTESTKSSEKLITDDTETKEITTTATTERTTIKAVTTKTTTKIQTTQKPTTTTTYTEYEEAECQNSYSENDLYVLSHIIVGEADGCSDAMQLAVGSVVLNRVKSPYYPNSIEGVAFQSGQYACTWDGNYYKSVDSRTLNNARYLLENGSILPSNVVYQAEFVQGSGVYKQIGNTYFCYY